MKSNKITKPNANAVGAHDCAHDHKGITLVALIITIIVMLILVGVSITIALNGGLFDTTKRAAKQTEEAKRKEQELASGRVKIDNVWYDSIEDYAIGKPSKIQQPEDLNENNTKITYTPEGWTNGEVKVGIDASSVSSGFILKYSTDNINWYDYSAEIPMSANGQVYAKLVDVDGNEGGEVTANVTNIDENAPKINTHIAKNGEETDTSIPLSINVIDEVSGISKIEWYYKKSTDPESKYEENKKTDEYKTINGKEAGEKTAVTKETTLTGLSPLTTYNIYAQVFDVAGNSARSPKTGAIEITTKEPKIRPKIGDYVLYEPDPVSSPYELAGEASGYGDYSGTPKALTTPKSQSIPQENLTWQVLKVHDNGTVDIIGSLTPTTVYFQGALGYNNGVYLMNDICKKLYSKTSKGIGEESVRSVNLEDFEDKDNGGNWEAERKGYTYPAPTGLQYGDSRTYTDADNRYYPNLYAQENGSGITSSNPYYTSPTTETYSQADSNGLIVKQTYYDITINPENYGESAKVLKQNTYYWLASRYSTCNETDADFGFFKVGKVFSYRLRVLL